MNILRKRRKSKKKFNAHKLILIIFFLMMTTFAWFTYYSVLNVGLDIHMVSWDVQFFLNGKEQSDLIEIEVPALYPGMEEQIYEIKVKNNGEATVDVSYYIEELNIIGNKYDILQSGETTTNKYYVTLETATVTDNVAYQNIINDTAKYPFKIDAENTILLGTGEEGYIKLKISWEGENDQLDSKWGYDVGKYFKENEDATSAMRLLIRTDVIQAAI